MFICPHLRRFFLSPFFPDLNSLRTLFPLFFLLTIISLGCPATVLGAKYKVQGVSGPVKKNIEVFLAAIPDPQGEELSRYRAQLEKASLEALQAFGYYQPVITIKIEKDTKNYLVEIEVAAGQPVRVKQLDLKLQGEAQQDPEFQNLLTKHELQEDKPFNHGAYEELKSRFSELATTMGYFDAHWQEAKVEISIEKKSAWVTLIFDSQQRYRFGGVTVSGAPKLHELILATRPFKSGDHYSSDKVADYNIKLSDSDFFRSVVVRPDLDNRADGIIPITVMATPYAANIVSVGGGYSTDIGLRGILKWTLPRINSAGHSITSGLEVSEPEQKAIVSYKIPLEDAYENYGSIQTGYQHKESDDTTSSKYTLQGKRLRKLSNQWERAYILSYELEDSQLGGENEWSSLILPGISFTRTRSRGGLNVHWGDRLQLYLEVSDPAWGSDIRLAKVRGRAKWVRTAGDNQAHKFIARADLGAIAVDAIENVPVSLRFFTGGDQTIRGFDYESISPRDDEGLLVGGQYLTVGSLEYSYLLLEKWRVASFVDFGTATNDFNEPLSVGSGVGVRWITPVGPLRLDLAFAISESDNPWMIHFSMGPDL